MADVDFSQSIAPVDGAEKSSFFNSSTVISLLILTVVAAGWGGLRFYLYTLDKKIATLDAPLIANAKQLQGESIDRVVDFSTRVALFQKDAAESIDPRFLLGEIEAAMVSGIVLTKYDYNVDEKIITIAGTTDNFRKLAEQVVSFKGIKTISQVKVDDMIRDKEGRINFILEAYLY